MSKLFFTLGTVWTVLAELFIVYAAFQQGFWKGFIRMVWYHINPLMLLFFVPSLILFGLAHQYERERSKDVDHAW